MGLSMATNDSERQTNIAIIAAVVFFLFWFALNRWVLPYFGIYT